MCLVPGVEEQVAAEEMDYSAGRASIMSVDRIVEIGSSARKAGCRRGGGCAIGMSVGTIL